MEEIMYGDGIQCDTCGFIIRSDGTEDKSEIEEESEWYKNKKKLLRSEWFVLALIIDIIKVGKLTKWTILL